MHTTIKYIPVQANGCKKQTKPEYINIAPNEQTKITEQNEQWCVAVSQ